MKRRKGKNHFGLMLMFTVVVFCALLVNMAITGAVVYLLAHIGILSISETTIPHVNKLLFVMACVSVPVGMVVALSVSKVPLKPIRELIAGMNRLSSGDFGTRIRVGPVMKYYPTYVELAESFNKMARELERTQMLSSDFVNNFSHEFKTPIVSIAGFAKLLKRGNLTEAQKKEYLDVIEEESLRLSYMATNVLNLTRVENQTILTDVSEYNLSEQIRACILLLEDKWSKKNLDFILRVEEHMIHGSEELLKQVWINLLDNAIKFSPGNRSIDVWITETEKTYQVSVRNTGSEITPDQQSKIFDKFYQADESHATQGNGVGLAIVKRIAQLHGGSVSVSSAHAVTVFTVELPK